MRQSMTIRLEPNLLELAKQAARSENRTLTNYIETLIQKNIHPMEPDKNKDKLFSSYSSGEINRRQLEDQTGLTFGEILHELAIRKLKLPRVNSIKLMNKKQKTYYEEIFGK